MSVVSVTLEGRLAWVVIDNPPVNAAALAVRQGLLDAVSAVSGCELAVLRGAGRAFVAGGDMTEFDRPAEPPHLPDVIDAIEASDTPFLALIDGPALGGGLEIAMACAFRIASAQARFGLPEVTVGLIPGAGGSQRAPRLFGWAAAADMACSGKILTADQALALGAVDEIATDLETAARAHRVPRPTPVSQRPAPPLDPVWLDTTRQAIAARARGQTAPLDNLDALSWAVLPYAAGQLKERARHLELRSDAQAVALRRLFFAERAVAKPPPTEGAGARPLRRATIVGGGLMGAGIAASCLGAGIETSVIERDDAAAGAAKDRIVALVAGALARGKIDRQTYEARLATLSCGASDAAAEGADVVIEAVYEDAAVKRDVFKRMAATAPESTVLATNTSYLDPREIFAGASHPERCLGLHFFSPAHLMHLLEIVPTPATSPETLATAFALARKLNKVGVVAGICDGFIGNRMLAAYRRAAEYMLADGAWPEQVDAAMRDFGMAMGPFEAQDLAGLQIAHANRRRQDATRDPAERYVEIADRLCAMGRDGKSAGRGWHLYPQGAARPQPDPAVAEVIEAYAAEKGVRRRAFTAEEIQRQLLAVLANEGARIVEEGVAASDAAVDVVKTLGYGFPRWRGGPMHAADQLGAGAIADALQELDAASPNSWVRARRYDNEDTGGTQ